MDLSEKLFKDLINADNYKSVECFLDRLDFLYPQEIDLYRINEQVGDLFYKEFLNEVKEFTQNQVFLHFGKTLKDLKCMITDQNFREHVIWIQYMGPRNLRITDMNLPRSNIQDQVYKSIKEMVNILRKHISDLSNYFDELSQIDKCCTVVEPMRPTFKEDYRKIHLADKVWLHVEVSPDGSAKNLSIIGQFDQRELQELLQAWDHDKDIATNVSVIASSLNQDILSGKNQTVVVPDCGICYCVELPGDTKVPQPLCNNSKCGAYFHRSCLYEWLVACAGGRTPQFGVGKCPSCSQYIQCSDRDI